MKIVIFLSIFFCASEMFATEVVYSTSTRQIVEYGGGDKSRFVGDPRYVIVTDVPDSELKKVGENPGKFIYSPASRTVTEKPALEIKNIARVENKAKIVDLKIQLVTLESLRASEADAETIVILDGRINGISDAVTELETLNDGLR